MNRFNKLAFFGGSIIISIIIISILVILSITIPIFNKNNKNEVVKEFADTSKPKIVYKDSIVYIHDTVKIKIPTTCNRKHCDTL